MNAPRKPSAPTRALAVALLAGFAAMIAAYVPSPLRLLSVFESVPEPEVNAPPALKMAAVPAKETFGEITARPLFNNGRLPDPPKAPGAAIAQGEAESANDPSLLRVVGIVTDRETQLALVQTASGATARVRPGDTLEGWRIEKIDVQGVTASDGVRSTRLVIPRAHNAAAGP